MSMSLTESSVLPLHFTESALDIADLSVLHHQQVHFHHTDIYSSEPTTNPPSAHTQIASPAAAIMRAVQKRRYLAKQTTQTVAAANISGGPHPPTDLPEVPTWVMDALTAIFGLLFMLAVALFLMQFPPRFRWLTRKVEGWRRPGYTLVEQEDHELHEGFASSNSSSATTSAHFEHRGGVRDRANTLRKRRPSHLSIDTSVQYHGLGIAVPGDTDMPKTAEEPCLPRTSPNRSGWKSFTAPLPAAETFNHRTMLRGAASADDVESGRESAWLFSSELFDSKAMHETTGQGVQGEEPDSHTVLEKLNGWVYELTDRLSKTFYDYVDEPEEGLLLAVRNEERESPLIPGAFVE